MSRHGDSDEGPTYADPPTFFIRGWICEAVEGEQHLHEKKNGGICYVCGGDVKPAVLSGDYGRGTGLLFLPKKFVRFL